MTDLVLSLFPGLDLFGRAFRGAGFAVVTGPDRLIGDDMADFVTPPAGSLDGIIGGPPCQDFSAARGTQPIYDGDGVRCLGLFASAIAKSRPRWFLCENVPRVPDLRIEGYHIQRLDLTDAECGGNQKRLRHIQFGSLVTGPGEVTAQPLVIRPFRDYAAVATMPAITKRFSGGFRSACKAQGLVTPLRLPWLNETGRRQTIANAVPIAMGRTLADAVIHRGPIAVDDCLCLCGRRVTRKLVLAGDACRQRFHRRRTEPRPTLHCDRGGNAWFEWSHPPEPDANQLDLFRDDPDRHERSRSHGDEPDGRSENAVEAVATLRDEWEDER